MATYYGEIGVGVGVGSNQSKTQMFKMLFDTGNNELIKSTFREMNDNFSFPLYLLFRNLFSRSNQPDQINNLIASTDYDIIYGIYNGTQLLKTIFRTSLKDSSKFLIDCIFNMVYSFFS